MVSGRATLLYYFNQLKWSVSCVKRILQIPISWKQYAPYSRTPPATGVGAKAGPWLWPWTKKGWKERRKLLGYSWNPKVPVRSGWGGKGRAEVGGAEWQSSERGGGAQVCGRRPVILADPHSWRKFNEQQRQRAGTRTFVFPGFK